MQLQLIAIQLWIFPLMSMQTDVVHLSNSGPVIKGSEIVFKAEVLDGTSHPVQDEKYFEYHWLNTADFLTATTKGYKNTTHKDCYEWFIPAREYKMTVRVCDLRDNKECKYVGKAETHFKITEGLNGNLNISQDLKYRNPNSSAVYSTHKPVRLHLNLTDKFKEKPTMDYTWFVDGEILLVTNTPEKDLPIRDTGEHEIKVDARATETVPDCGDFRDEDVKGQFIETVILKDPVAVNMSGTSVFSTKDPIVINITLNGSDPFTVCWSSNQTIGMECIDDWCCQEVYNDAHCNITVASLTAGNYSFNISIANDISIIYRQHNVTVSEPPPIPSNHSAADVLLPVIGALFVICLLLATAIYVTKVRKKKQVEVADFDFHPHISSTARHRNNFVTNVKYAFQQIFERNNYEKMHTHASYAPVPSGSYGSLEETTAKQSLYETL